MQNYTFQKGLHTDFNPEVQPQGTYRNLRNFYREDSGELISEKGHSLLFNGESLSLKIIGGVILESEIVLFLCNNSNTVSEIGVVDENDNYSPYISNRSGSSALLQLSTNALAFKTTTPIDAEAKKHSGSDRIIYFVDGENDDRSVNLDELPDELRFTEEISLQFNTLLPKIIDVEVNDNGSLSSGIYQFVARYVTNGGNTTPAGVISNPIPVAVGSRTLGDRDFVAGGEPQSEANKAIKITLTNLDQNYPFLEIIAITLVGIANIPSYNIVGRVDNDGSNKEFTYYDSNSQQLGIVTLDEITIQPAKYLKSKNIEQKDGILIRSNVQSEAIDIDIQSQIANNISVEYFRKSRSWGENITIESEGVAWNTLTDNRDATKKIEDAGLPINSFEDYKKEENTFYLKTWMREEVYNLCFIPVYKGGTIGFSYHIPGQHLVDTSPEKYNGAQVTANQAHGKLGTYISTVDYPLIGGYPSGKVRFHRMPTEFQEPITFFNAPILLGLKITIPSFPSEIKDKMQGYIIGYQPRNSSTARTIVAQGLAKHWFTVEDPVSSGSTFKVQVPSLGKMSTHVYGIQNGLSHIDKKTFSFFAPDFVHGMVDEYSHTHIKHGYSYSAQREFDNRRSAVGGAANRSAFWTERVSNIFNMAFSGTVLSEPPDIQLEGTKLKIEAQEINREGLNDNANTPEEYNYLGFQSPFSTEVGTEYRLRGTRGFTLLKSVSDLPFAVQNGTPENLEEHYDSDDDSGYIVHTETPIQEVFTLKNKIGNIYGDITNSLYNIAFFKVFGETQTNEVTGAPLTNDNVAYMYGGDTFINKYAMHIGDQMPWSLSNDEDGRGAHTDTIAYFWCQTLGNYNFRHYNQADTIDNELTPSDIPFFPKYTLIWNDPSTTPLGHFNIFHDKGYPTKYNKHYSKLNDIRQFFPKPINFVEETNFPNRNIYSETSLLGELADNYRIFLPNNYQEVPKDKGEITNTFIYNNDFYIHCPQGLFKAFVNTREIIFTDVSQVSIGTGKAFTSPPKEILDADDGYMGTTSKWAGIVTPYGYIFPDNIRGKVFMLTDKSIKEVSDIGNAKLFEGFVERLDEDIVNGVGFVAGYDRGRKRYVLTKLGQDTISFQPKLDSWTGWHDYKPNFYMNKDKRHLYVEGGNMYVYGVGVQGQFLSQSSQSKLLLELSLNLPKDSKVFDNLNFGYKALSQDGRIRRARMFSNMKAYTVDQNSGDVKIVYSDLISPTLSRDEIKVSYVQREYRMGFPPDSIIDSYGDIHDVNNIDYSKQFRGRLHGDYCVLELTYDPSYISSLGDLNDPNYTSDLDLDIIVEYITLIFRSEQI